MIGGQSDMFAGTPPARMPPHWIKWARTSPEPDPIYRWELKRSWRRAPACAWLMLNPSDADSYRDDLTILRVIHFTFAWGYGSAVVLNLYPWKAPAPSSLWAWLDRHGAEVYELEAMRDNLATIAAAAAACDRLVVAYGTGAGRADPRWLGRCLRAFSGDGDRLLHALGRTRGNWPIHPLARGRHRVPDFAEPIVWGPGWEA